MYYTDDKYVKVSLPPLFAPPFAFSTTKNKKKIGQKTHRTDIYFFSALLFYNTL